MQAIDEKIIAVAHRMADSAGDILRHYFRAPIAVESKSDTSPVTRADREVEQAIRALIEENFPQHGIIGEEFGALRPDADFQWVIDPIDGTRAFIAGYTSFTTLIALAYKGAPQLGIIDQPITCERWLGLEGATTTMGGKPVFTRPCAALAKAVIATTSTNYFTPPQAALFEMLSTQCRDIVLGGDAYAYAMLASGQMDIVVDAGMKPYDYCALRPVIEGAGGVITDWDGKPIATGSDGRVLAAATPQLHALALSVLQAAA